MFIRILFLLGLLAPLSHSTEVELSREIYNHSELPFIKHTVKAPFQSYLAMNLKYQPAADTLTQIEKLVRRTLKHRDEAHITVISPPEYDNVLSKFMSIERIHEIAEMSGIQESKFQVLCVGVGTARIDTQKERTYYIVVRSKHLQYIRHKIHSEFVKSGGNPSAFNPRAFYPHITLGFTSRDLHIEDGVKKDNTSCRYELTMH